MTATADLPTLPAADAIESMFYADIVKTFNAYAPIAGRTPVRKFETRAIGVKRLTDLVSELRAKGVTAPAPDTAFPVEAKPAKAKAAKAPKAKPTAAAPKAKLDKAAPAKPAKVAKPAAPKAKPAKAPAGPAKKPDGNLSIRLRELINEGLDNDAVWEIIRHEYDIPRGYISGQRRAMAKRAEKAAAKAQTAAKAKSKKA